MPYARSRQVDGRISVGLMVICLGVIFLLGNIYPNFNFWRFLGRLWPIALVVAGVYIISAQYKFRNLASLRSAAHSRAVGDLRIDYTGKEIGDIVASQIIGDLSADLTSASLRPGVNTLNISGIIGDSSIIVSASFPLKVSARSMIGSLRLDNKHEEGFLPKLEYADSQYDSAADKLQVTASGVIGDFSLQRK